MLVTTAPLVHRVPTAGGILKRAKYVARGLAFSRCTREWFDFLRTPELAVIVRNHPYLYHKLQRPYLHCALSTLERLTALKQHYGFVLERFPLENLEVLYGTAGILLASFHLNGLGTFQLRLSSSRRQKEGDFSVELVKDGLDGDLFAVAFSILKSEGGCYEIFMGGLQGGRGASKDFVVQLTRALYGLRPKALLVFAVQQLAMHWSISRLRAVSDARHIYRHFQKRKVLAASYDEFWRDCGGELSADGLFDLPAVFAPRDISTIKVNKRQMYRRRYHLLENLADQIRGALPGGGESVRPL